MRRRLTQLRTAAAALGFATALAVASDARADGFSGSAEPQYSAGESHTKDQSGATQDTRFWMLDQRYRLSFNRDLFPSLRLGADASYDWGIGNSITNGVASDADTRRLTLNGRLTGGNDLLSYGLNYSRSQLSSETTSEGKTSSSPTLISENLILNANLRPADLPQLMFFAGRSWAYDLDRKVSDQTNDSAQLQAHYVPTPPVDLIGSFRVDHPVDHLNGTDSVATTESGRVSYSDSFYEKRLPVYVSYAATHIGVDTQVHGTGGTVATLRTPTAGLSAVEAFPDTPQRITLGQNPALVDGNLTAGVGIDLGFARTAAGDTHFRDLGAQLPDLLTSVNTFYVWIDRPLAPEVVTAMGAAGAWTVYRSDDNLTWSQVPIVAPVVFGLFNDRFEITIPETQARYLKVVTRPLATGITTDDRAASILVTELQLVLVVPAEAAKGHTSNASGQLNGAAKYVIDPSTSFAADTALSVTHRFGGGPVTYAVVNGIGAAPRLNEITTLSARGEWSDADFGQGRDDQLRWGANLAVDPIPTLGSSLGYSGIWRHSALGIAYTNSMIGGVRADLYEGISVGGTGSYGVGRAETGQDTTSANASATATFVPHKTMTTAGTYGYTWSRRTGAGLPESTSSSQNLEGTAAWSPIHALYLSGGIARLITNNVPQTTGSFAAGVSPFPGANLQLRFQYAERFDTATHLRTRNYGPSARWTVLPTLYVDVSYTDAQSFSDAEDTKSRIFFARLFWAVR
jgi:hypothetical protein